MWGMSASSHLFSHNNLPLIFCIATAVILSITGSAPFNGTSDQNGTAKNGSTPAASGSAATEKLLNGSQATTASKSGLKDQRELSLQDSLELFVARYELYEISFALFELNLSIAPAD